MSRNSDPSGALVLGMGAGAFLFFKGFRKFREYKVLADTPRIPIRSVPMGFVHVRGKAESGQLLESPLTRTRCCFYRVQIDEYHHSNRSGEWKHVCTDMDGKLFFLDDGTGRVLIDGKDAEFDLPESSSCEVNSAHAEDADSQRLLNYVMLARTRSFTNGVSNFFEKRMEAASHSDDPQVREKQQAFQGLVEAIPEAMKTGKAPIDAWARLVQSTGPFADAAKEQKRQEMLRHIDLARTLGQNLTIPMAGSASGRFRLREYVIVPQEEYQVSGTCVANEAGNEETRNMIVRGHNEKTFVISSHQEREQQSSLRGSAVLSILGGAVLTLLCLAMLLGHLGLL